MTDWQARCDELERAIDDQQVVIKRLSEQVRNGWPICTCHHCWQEPSESSSEACPFVRAWDRAVANMAAINIEATEMRRRCGLDWPHEPNRRFD